MGYFTLSTLKLVGKVHCRNARESRGAQKGGVEGSVCVFGGGGEEGKVSVALSFSEKWK